LPLRTSNRHSYHRVRQVHSRRVASGHPLVWCRDARLSNGQGRDDRGSGAYQGVGEPYLRLDRPQDEPGKRD
jgi:hypothetical protein